MITAFTGNISTMAVNSLAASKIKSDYRIRQTGIMTSEEKMKLVMLKSGPEIKVVPDNLLLALKLMYGNRCLKCSVLCNSSHLAIHHQFEADILGLMRSYQDKKSRRSARNNISKLLRKVKQLTTTQ